MTDIIRQLLSAGVGRLSVVNLVAEPSVIADTGVIGLA